MRLFLVGLILLTSVFASEQNFKMYKKGKSKTLLVIGGIHGNEPGSYFAPAVLATHYKITSGNVWIIPNLNAASIVRFRRGYNGDMNRKFSYIKENDPDKEAITKIKQLITNPQVDLILNLHDGHGFYRKNWENTIFNPKAWGQSCVIDQDCIDSVPFGNLDEIALKVSKAVNKNLSEQHHMFSVKNTKTKDGNQSMELSLTYFAIKNNKPAFAIETSKNITDLTEKVRYQLVAIEEFMNVMGIEFERDFKLENGQLRKIVENFGDVVINNKFLLPLDGARTALNYIPIDGKLSVRTNHPLIMVYRTNGRHNIMGGHKRLVSIKTQKFKYTDKKLDFLPIEIDGKKDLIKVPSRFYVKDNFKVLADDDVRVNIIGFSKRGYKNENGLVVSKDNYQSGYSVDRKGKCLRVEVYQRDTFLGMTLACFTDENLE